MAAQQTIIAETIRGMKLAMRRRDNDSDSDTSITQPTNRANKLKRNARHVREGRLDTTHARPYKQRIDYAGYHRYILHDNPLRFDDDGDLIDDDDDYDHDRDFDPQDNPWAETKLEDLLAPLTSAAHLAEHPSLSVPFLSRPISEMAENARQAMHREKETLWHIKQLLLRLRGDDYWIPVGKLESEHDLMLLDPSAAPIDDPFSTLPPPPSAIDHYKPQNHTQPPPPQDPPQDPPQQNGTQPHSDELPDAPQAPPSPDASPEALTQHAMTTRRQARTSPSPNPGFPSPSPAPSSIPSIHGFFHVPDSALPDRDYGLPASEADDTRRLLLLFCQKQEQVVRESEQMLEGLLKADRMRKDVWRWCKAEAHMGEMSDGEDWYDMDEWNLNAPLLKGKEEEEVEDESRVKGRRRRGAQH